VPDELDKFDSGQSSRSSAEYAHDSRSCPIPTFAFVMVDMNEDFPAPVFPITSAMGIARPFFVDFESSLEGMCQPQIPDSVFSSAGVYLEICWVGVSIGGVEKSS
jgi:hypothetical protein